MYFHNSIRIFSEDSTVDMVVQRRDGPLWLRELDDDDDDDDDDILGTAYPNYVTHGYGSVFLWRRYEKVVMLSASGFLDDVMFAS